MSGNVKRVAVLGASGSIGGSVLDVLDRYGEELGLEIVLLSARSRGRELYDRFRDRKVTVISDDNFGAHGTAAHVKGTEALSKPETYENVDIVVNGIGGIGGTLPSFAAVEAGAKLVTANKESIVAAGKMLLKRAKERSVPVIPVDSEHSAAFQCLLGEDAGSVEKIILTASGGAFRDMSAEEIARTRAADALKHPNWKMGVKVTVDSATLMNKGLEVIEAKRLFGVQNVDIVVHRESVIHALVQFKDGTSKLCMSPPDMRIPIQYALTAPVRREVFAGDAQAVPKGFEALSGLTFSKPDLVRFPCLKLALEVARGDSEYNGAVLCAADETAVSLYMCGAIGFYGINEVVSDALDAFAGGKLSAPEELASIESEVGEYILEKYGGIGCS